MRLFWLWRHARSAADGTDVGSFSPKDIVFGGSYSHDITDRLRGGIELKGIYSSYADYSAFALATDLGINYYNPGPRPFAEVL